jgi:glycosyltransferase involved in cell wall biosynthesis
MSADTTIFVISYNYGHFLADAIRSALSQSHPVDVVIVDDGSTDDTPAVAAGFGDTVAYWRKANGGLSDARNYAAQRCSTPFLVYLDADNRLPPDYVSSCRARIDQSPDAAFVYTQLEYFGDQAGRSSFPDFDADRLRRGNYINSGGLLRTDVVRRHPYDTQFRAGLEDWEFNLTLVERGLTGVLCDSAAVEFRMHGSSMGAGVQRMAWRRRMTYARVLWKHRAFMGWGALAGMVSRSARYRIRRALHRGAPATTRADSD